MIDPLVKEFHSRDLDSLPSEREVAAVEEFSNNQSFHFHIMRDHRQHIAPVTAGMWGAKPLLDMDFSHFFISKIFEASLNPDILRNEKYTDQTILARYLYPYLNGNNFYILNIG